MTNLQNGDETAIDAEEIPDLSAETALELRRPSTPATLSEIAALGGEGVKIVKARVQILETLKAASISMTHPEDWLLFKDKDGNIKCYLMDAGCDRISALWGIEIFNISDPVKIVAEDKSFCYVVVGDGRCAITGQVVEKIEGMRASTDDIAKTLKGAKQEYVVRKSARANLDGSVLRELSGFKNVPLSVLEETIPGKNWRDRGTKGKGFGSSGERQMERETDVDLSSPAPKCPKCGGDMWDNRRDKLSGRTNPKAPDFKCKNKGACDGVVWQGSKKSAAPPQESRQPDSPTGSPAPVEDEQPGPTAAPSGNPDVAQEEERLRKLIKSQIKGLRWDGTKQREFFDEFAESANLPAGSPLTSFKHDSLMEIHEDLKKGTPQ
jgi:hypothetical protein